MKDKTVAVLILVTLSPQCEGWVGREVAWGEVAADKAGPGCGGDHGGVVSGES
jgi:hypothetical protein